MSAVFMIGMAMMLLLTFSGIKEMLLIDRESCFQCPDDENCPWTTRRVNCGEEANASIIVICK
jgi:hypothetical protein